MKNLNKVVAIFGYNNSRIYDVIKIQKLVKALANADILLVKEGINSADLEVTQYCLDACPDDSGISEVLKEYLNNNNLEILGCLPFSDKGVVGAAYVAKALNLFGDDAVTSHAMLDKSLFRKLESSIPIDLENYKKPFSHTFATRAEIENLFLKQGPFFIKPKAEGNSRGCMKIMTTSDLQQWFYENESSVINGIICEEILSDTNEYSFDGVNGNYWITEKFTTSGAFRAEYQQIVPAPLVDSVQKKVHKVLAPLMSKLGSNGGAFHHEFFILNSGKIASVEPNRRPAGMWIWDLAAWNFENFNPWDQWIKRCLDKNSLPQVELKSTGYTGIRGVISKRDGKIQSIKRNEAETALKTRFGDHVRLSFLKSESNTIRCMPRDNSDFLAFVAIKNESYDGLLSDLAIANDIILNSIEVVS